MAGLVFWLVWVVVALLAAAVTFAAWYGPNQDISNLSRWAWLLGWRRRPMPRWFQQRVVDRWGMIGGAGMGVILILLAADWFWTPSPIPVTPAPEQASLPPAAPSPNPAPAPPGTPQQSTRPDRELDDELKNAILVHVPKAKQVRLLVLAGDRERERFADQIETFARTAGYQVVPRKQFIMGGDPPAGTMIYPDEKEQNIVNIRIGTNDR